MVAYACTKVHGVYTQLQKQRNQIVFETSLLPIQIFIRSPKFIKQVAALGRSCALCTCIWELLQ